MFVSETYEVLDCIRIDNGTSSDHSDIWNTNTTSATCIVTRASDYTEFKEANVGTNFSNGVTGLTGSCVIEFDYWQLDGLSSTFLQILDSSNNLPYSGGLYLQDLGGSLSTWYHLKFTISNNVLTILNETNNTSVTKNLSATPVKFNFWSSGDVSTLRFKNFRIYPI